jgi:glycosyltransferase involved in cell wall biosynthesis
MRTEQVARQIAPVSSTAGASSPRCLWLTLADPEPRFNGQFLYSGGLIDALAAAGAEVEVLGLSRVESPRRCGDREENIAWWLAEAQVLSHWGSLRSALPHTAYRCATPGMHKLLDDLLARQDWDGIVFDGISVGWALAPVLRRYPDPLTRPRLIYVSHNHEESLRASIADNQQRFLKRQAIRLDACKVARVERQLVDNVDLVTAITAEDLDLYRRRRPDGAMTVLTPGYGGRRVMRRPISPAMPRRAIIVGSFDWIAKRMNLEEFVTAADHLFAAAGAELQVIGSAEESFLQSLRRRVKATELTGTVPEVTGFLDQARIAIVPERSGGGFKLKVLEYVFNRLPIFALEGSVAGMPLRHGDSIMLYPDHDALARGILGALDDLDLLNRLQENAFDACRDVFDWSRRGRMLHDALSRR